jgi:hypothetical protein
MTVSIARLRFPALWWGVGAGGLVLVVVLSLIRHAPQIPGDTNGGLGHVMAYATLMGWFARLMRGGPARLGAAAALCALGIALEFAQEATGYRTFDTADMVADAIGVALGWLASPPRIPDGIARVDREIARLIHRDNRSDP